MAPLAQDKDLGAIKVDNGASLLTFTGTLLNCNNAPVANGYVFINFKYAIDGHTHKEIAQLLSISEGTSKWHLSEARKQLQQMIVKEEVKL